jgi:predicted NACHT family NTPase
MTARDHVSGAWLSWLHRLEIQAFDEGEIREFVEQWLDRDPISVATFYEKLRHVPSLASLMKIPLLGTLILAVYKHGHESLPESRPRLYEMFVRLLAGGWDAAKNVNRGSKFNPQEKIAVLSHLAGLLHLDRKRDCTAGEIQGAIRERIPGLQIRGSEILGELIADGLLVPTGAILSFPHLSFQEFLAAKDLMELRPDRANLRLDSYLSGDDWWRDVVTFYVSFHDKPGEMEAWICAGVTRIMPKVSAETVRARAIELCNVVLTGFSNFQFSRDTRALLQWTSESAFDIAKRKASATRD